MLLLPLVIQLWSNKDESAFAVRLSTDQQDCFRATVTVNNHDNSSSSKFTKIADEMYYDESFHYEWPFMLERWIEAWKSGFRHSSSIPALQRWDYTASSKGISSSFRHESNSKGSRSGSIAAALLSEPDNVATITKTKRQEKKNGSRSGNRKDRKRQKPNLKCHYCNLIFHKELERSAHEETWHADKLLLKSSSNNNGLKLGGYDNSSSFHEVGNDNNGR